jgi:hypothetical protein
MGAREVKLGKTVLDVALKAIRPVFEAHKAKIGALDKRIEALEQRAGIGSATDHEPGDVIEMAGARWQCRGAGRWRKVE